MMTNRPLRRAQIEALPLGFTPTAVMPSRREINEEVRILKAEHHTNRRRTPGRLVKYIRYQVLDHEGNLPVNESGEQVVMYRTKQLLHKRRAA